MKGLFILAGILACASAATLSPACSFTTRASSKFLPIVFNNRGLVLMDEDLRSGSMHIALPSNDFTLYCSGANNTLKYFGTKFVTARCDDNGFIQTEYGSFTFDDFQCSIQAETVTRNGTCYNGNTKIQIKLDNVPFIEVCFNEERSETLYSYHIINGPDLDKSESINRPSFKESEFYPNIDADQCYKTAEQIETIAEIVGSTSLANQYIQASKQYFLSRGHLTPNGDGIWAEEKRATFYFINVVPQWQISNAGNWERLESSLRTYAGNKKVLLDVYTGAHGVTTLFDVNHNEQPIYLGKDSSGKLLGEVLPVPRIMYKVIINKAAGTGAVVVQMNNPYEEYLKASDIICPDICSQLSWVNWDIHDIKKGYTYCCDLKSFYSALPIVPNPGDLPLMK